jgi:FAD synthase
MNTVTGRVVKGLQIGREMGFPTVNLNLRSELDRPYGVYVVDVFVDKLRKKGLLYYGPRKIARLPEQIVCEVTILDFEGDLYDKSVKISVGQFLRGPRKFETVLDLKKQIEKDILIARHRKFI